MKELIEALQIFAQYSEAQFPTTCEHDVLYLNVVKPEDVSDEHKKRLDKLGFFVDESIGVWVSYRFGSN